MTSDKEGKEKVLFKKGGRFISSPTLGEVLQNYFRGRESQEGRKRRKTILKKKHQGRGSSRDPRKRGGGHREKRNRLTQPQGVNGRYLNSKKRGRVLNKRERERLQRGVANRKGDLKQGQRLSSKGKDVE